MARSGNLFIVSGPSGAGKSAIAAGVLNTVPNLRFSISYTTRPPRGTEKDGIEYNFVSEEEFQELIRSGDLLEWALVYGNYYGTSKRRIDEILQQGIDVLLDIDVQGARSIRGKRPEAIAIFILPPSYKVLRERLESRKLDKEYVIEQRLKIASQEIVLYKNYDYLIINETLEDSICELTAIILGSRCRMAARAGTAKSILATFGGLDAEDP
ncbi:MAG TPA: guanylate kinase [Acidobacteriota bacterium]|nr:guanylate kinase [Acidobacteriota bacterium]